MKKICVILMVSAFLFCGGMVFAAPVYIDDVVMECEYKDIEGVKYLPVREFCEELGYKVFWNSQNSSICILKTEDCLNRNGYYKLIILVADNAGITTVSEDDTIDFIDTMDNRVQLVDGVSYMSAYYLCRALDVPIKNIEVQNGRLDLYNR